MDEIESTENVHLFFSFANRIRLTRIEHLTICVFIC